ncbi:MAG: hypothetical protein IAG10_10945 [Planctomycetaceae bacterium]|nr:hypothetical protein [Planctomycetaceae bacterium]
MDDIKELADEIYADRLRRARERRPMLKLLDGFDLFDEVCGRMRAGIRAQFPSADETEVEGILQARIDRLRAIEEFGLYRPFEEETH